jgi:hypothetical protein
MKKFRVVKNWVIFKDLTWIIMFHIWQRQWKVKKLVKLPGKVCSIWNKLQCIVLLLCLALLEMLI